jgi:hypothetical protein
MKQFYSLTTTVLALFFFSFSLSAQYTAVRPGSWQADIPANSVWDVSGQPPSICNNCVITIMSGNNIALNTSVTLTGNSQLIIGTNSALGSTQLAVPAGGSSGTGFASGFNIIMDNPGNVGASKIVLSDNVSSISVPATAPASKGNYDGVFTSNNGFLKLLGNLPVGFNADGSIKFTGLSVGSSLNGAVTLTAPGDLPIVLTAFTAQQDNKTVDLNWTSVLEINSDHFAVERSTDAGAHWSVLSTIPAHGSSSQTVNYSFNDMTPSAGTNQYRLQLVDRDGNYAYSVVKAIRMGLISSVSIYPNPARDYVNVTLSGSVTPSVNIRLISQSGQLLMEKQVDNAVGTTVSLPVSSYPQGNYLILVTGTDGVQQVSKLLISKQ